MGTTMTKRPSSAPRVTKVELKRKFSENSTHGKLPLDKGKLLRTIQNGKGVLFYQAYEDALYKLCGKGSEEGGNVKKKRSGSETKKTDDKVKKSDKGEENED